MNLIHPRLVLRQKLLNVARDLLISLDAFRVPVSGCVDDRDRERNIHAVLMTQRVGRDGVRSRVIGYNRRVIAHAFKAERIFPTNAQNVIDHAVYQRALSASGSAHQNDHLVIAVIFRWRNSIRTADVKPAEIVVG